MTSSGVDRLDVGPRAARPRLRVRRRLARAAVTAVGTSCVLLGVTLATSRGWRPPPVLPPLDVAALATVAPPDRHLPYAFVDRSETVVAGGLRARVVRPRGAEGTLPGLVLVAGSGATTRDDLADEAEALARGGLVVLTYDKRREGYSVVRRDYERLADDALAALDVVARQPSVDPDRLGLLGFSEGAWVVPLAAERSPSRVAFTILVSAPVVSPLDQAAWTVDRRLAAAPDPVRSSAATLLAMGRPVVVYLGTDVRPALAAAPQPTYAVWGAEDSSLPVRVAVDQLREATGARSRVEVVGGAGHRVPLASGWAERASDWVRRGCPTDDVVRGAQPVSLVGLATPPRPTRLGDPRLHLGLTALTALVAAAWPVRRQGRVARVRTASRRG
ncbi:alpha/beta hydrolase family protein [Microlunatus antarcticus]|uniref:Peptidase S9 prolyl oligopeptidase catalytic domain-containing protein n=1 Tax=Microlunatus antarcticus TaxID=53388 RepID=A0A7W5JZH4_9ACTN|nr:hypothetical protein [Microlunatus antarcticus]MBB3329006.1 hypothetical protein [Microlunatus antarcticus]